MYENFSAPSIESPDSNFNRLQKIRDKPDLDTMSFDDLYNNFKIVEQEVKGTTNSSSSSNSQNMTFVSSPSSTNEVNTAYRVSTANTQANPASTQVNNASTQVSTTNLSDATISRKTMNVEKTHPKAIVAVDGVGFDWSYMAEDEAPTNMALMAFSDSEVHTNNTCSKTCRKSYETLKKKYDDLRIELNKSEFNLATYKRWLTSIEEQLVFYKKNEVLFCKQIAVLKRDISYKYSEISVLKRELEKLKQEKESNQLKIEKFDNACKSLDKLIGNQIPDNNKKGLGFKSYHVVPPPPIGLFLPPKLDLSNTGLEEFQQSEFEGYGPKTSKSVSKDIPNELKEYPDASLVKDMVSDNKGFSVEFHVVVEKKTVVPTIAKVEVVRTKQQEKPVRKIVRERVVSGNNYTRVTYNNSTRKSHPNAHRNMAPRAVLMKIGLRPLNTARPINTAHPQTAVHSPRPMSRFSNSAQSTVKRPYQQRTTLLNKSFSQKVNTAKGNFYTARLRAVNIARPRLVNTTRPNSTVVNVVREFDGGYVTFGEGAKGGRITGKRTLKTGTLNFKDVYFAKELNFIILSVL
nr:hypothetical protein [Tanacetum cinerariifolium]